MVRVLNVAEKPSVAKTVSSILSHGSSSSVSAPHRSRSSIRLLLLFAAQTACCPDCAAQRAGVSKYNPVHEFRSSVFGHECSMRFTSVTGHLQELEFPASVSNWAACNPVVLFSSPISKQVPKDKQDIERSLQQEARQADWLLLWLDCDREGENIAFEVMAVCMQVAPQLQVMRARFSALIPADIHHALANLTTPSRQQSDAVEARMEIDLRIGAAFTRFQTLLLRDALPIRFDREVVSYGPCQFPTLGFVVEAWRRRVQFVRERYWEIGMEWRERGAAVGGPGGAGGDSVRWTWQRGRLFDRESCLLLYEAVCESEEVRVVQVDCQQRRRSRPLPLSTVSMQQRLSSSSARLSGQRSMDIAEKLYQRGIISYPRTETDRFKEGTDLRQLLTTLTALPGDCGSYATRLLGGAFVHPGDGGHDDGAHPPIHPTKAEAALQGEERVVYDFIVRHFLACCSADAVGQETVATAQCRPSLESFTARGLMVTERNYLDIYRYDRWTGRVIPLVQREQPLTDCVFSLHSQLTQPPPLLSESELIAAMDRHGIGTDATIAQHIDTIQKRRYVVLRQHCFIPSPLGLGLVDGYDEMGVSLSSPALRAHMESLCREVAEGRKGKEEVVRSVVDDMRQLLESVQERKAVLRLKVEEQLLHASLTPEQRVMEQQEPLGDEGGAPPPDDDSGGGGGGGGGGPGGGGDDHGGQQPGGGGHPSAPHNDSADDGWPADDAPPASSPLQRRRAAASAEGARGGDRRSKKKSGRSEPASASASASAAAVLCFYCRLPGHVASACTNKDRLPPGGAGGGAAARGNVECYRCRQKGHWARDCPNMQQG